jgi:esterase/lipase
MQNISFTSHGYKLSGNLFIASNPRPLAFLLIHGWMGHQNEQAAQALANLGFTSMTYDMRGHGDSEGNLADFSRADFVADAVVAYDFLKQKVGEDVAIGVVGSSLGSYTAVLLAEQRPVACLSLRVPASYPDKGFTVPKLRIGLGVNREWRNLPVSYDNKAFKALHNFTGKVQIIESELDEMVPHQAVQNYADSVVDKQNLQYVVMHGAPHTLESVALREEYLELLTNWVKKITAGKK